MKKILSGLLLACITICSSSFLFVSCANGTSDDSNEISAESGSKDGSTATEDDKDPFKWSEWVNSDGYLLHFEFNGTIFYFSPNKKMLYNGKYKFSIGDYGTYWADFDNGWHCQTTKDYKQDDGTPYIYFYDGNSYTIFLYKKPLN